MRCIWTGYVSYLVVLLLAMADDRPTAPRDTALAAAMECAGSSSACNTAHESIIKSIIEDRRCHMTPHTEHLRRYDENGDESLVLCLKEEHCVFFSLCPSDSTNEVEHSQIHRKETERSLSLDDAPCLVASYPFSLSRHSAAPHSRLFVFVVP